MYQGRPPRRNGDPGPRGPDRTRSSVVAPGRPGRIGERRRPAAGGRRDVPAVCAGSVVPVRRIASARVTPSTSTPPPSREGPLTIERSPSMNVVIVESPAKCRTINKYLGGNYEVLASFGHIRDLPPKDGSVRPDEDFSIDYEVQPGSTKAVKAIVDAVKEADSLILATDPDREGEAISWHVLETLRQKRAIRKDLPVRRVVFNSITKTAILDAMAAPARHRHGPGQRPAGPPGPGLPRRLLALAGPLAEAPRQQVGRPGPVGRPPADLRPRGRDRAVRHPGILGRPAAPSSSATRPAPASSPG